MPSSLPEHACAHAHRGQLCWCQAEITLQVDNGPAQCVALTMQQAHCAAPSAELPQGCLPHSAATAEQYKFLLAALEASAPRRCQLCADGGIPAAVDALSRSTSRRCASPMVTFAAWLSFSIDAVGAVDHASQAMLGALWPGQRCVRTSPSPASFTGENHIAHAAGGEQGDAHPILPRSMARAQGGSVAA